MGNASLLWQMEVRKHVILFKSYFNKNVLYWYKHYYVHYFI